MTVKVTKPAVNLREELASLRNQGGYSEQQFYFDNLVTNGTFDSDLSGWVDTESFWAVSAGRAYHASSSAYNPLTWTLTAAGPFKLTFDSDSITATGTAHLLIDNVSTQLLALGANSYSLALSAGTSTVRFSREPGSTAEFYIDNVSVYETDGTDVVHRMPKGWVPKDVYEDGLLQREGAAHDYTVVYDGFDYYVKPTVTPSATTQTCVIGVKA